MKTRLLIITSFLFCSSAFGQAPSVSKLKSNDTRIAFENSGLHYYQEKNGSWFIGRLISMAGSDYVLTLKKDRQSGLLLRFNKINIGVQTEFVGEVKLEEEIGFSYFIHHSYEHNNNLRIVYSKSKSELRRSIYQVVAKELLQADIDIDKLSIVQKKNVWTYHFPTSLDKDVISSVLSTEVVDPLEHQINKLSHQNNLMVGETVILQNDYVMFINKDHNWLTKFWDGTKIYELDIIHDYPGFAKGEYYYSFNNKTISRYHIPTGQQDSFVLKIPYTIFDGKIVMDTDGMMNVYASSGIRFKAPSIYKFFSLGMYRFRFGKDFKLQDQDSIVYSKEDVLKVEKIEMHERTLARKHLNKPKHWPNGESVEQRKLAIERGLLNFDEAICFDHDNKSIVVLEQNWATYTDVTSQYRIGPKIVFDMSSEVINYSIIEQDKNIVISTNALKDLDGIDDFPYYRSSIFLEGEQIYIVDPFTVFRINYDLQLVNSWQANEIADKKVSVKHIKSGKTMTLKSGRIVYRIVQRTPSGYFKDVHYWVVEPNN